MPEWERNQFVDETLTRAEREAPFRLGDGELEPIAGPTRLFLEIEEGVSGLVFAETDPVTCETLHVGRLGGGW